MSKVSFTQYQENVKSSQKVLRQFVDSIRAEQIRQNRSYNDATSYTLGYFESQMAHVIADLPKTKQAEILKTLSGIALSKTAGR